MPITIDQLVSSPACIPQWTLGQILPAYAGLGFTKFEAFCSWCQSALDISKPASEYLALAKANGMCFTSMHLPSITDDFDTSLDAAVSTAKYAQSLGANVVLFKANSRENYIKGAKPFIDALESQKIHVTPVLQNHKGTPITTLEDFKAIINGINDPRMKTLLEVGHFQRVGVSWRQGVELLGESIALVHINEIDDAGQSVPFGSGNVDFFGLFAYLSDAGYAGDIVVELELDTRNTDAQRTINELANALDHLRHAGIVETNHE